MRGYKIFDLDMKCRDFQYQVGETATLSGPIRLCVRGLHFCPRAIDCLLHYGIDNTRFAEVEAGECDPIGPSDKYATGSLRVIRELSRDEFVKMCTGTAVCINLGERTECVYDHGVLCRTTIRDTSGQKIKQINYVNGLKHGWTRSWWYTGIYASDAQYVKGVPHGIYRSWWPSGKLHTLVQYQNGKMHGRYQTWHQNGEYAEDCTYVDGLRQGQQLKWFDNGQLEERVNYVDGQVHGRCLYWWSNGRVDRDYRMSGGYIVGAYRRWYGTGQWMEETYMRNGNREGRSRKWDGNGRLTQDLVFSAGV